MLRFYAARYLRLTDTLSSLRVRFQAFTAEELSGVIPENDRTVAREAFETLRGDCVAMNLTSPQDQASRILAALEDPNLTLLKMLALQSDLQSRLTDELSHELFFHVDRNKAVFYENSCVSSAVTDAFPSATLDVEEAGKCFALGRYTACVFHLMRVTEHGLRALCAYLRVDCDFKTWQPVIEKLRNEVSNRDKSSFKGNLDFLRQTLERLTGIQVALRNEVMHARSFYDEERACDIYRSVMSFMQQLAEKLKAEDA